MHDLSRQKPEDVGSLGTVLSTGCACNASNKLLITRSGKMGEEREKRTDHKDRGKALNA